MECTEAAIERVMELEEKVKKEDAEFPRAFEVVEYEYYGGEIDRLEENTAS